jgi:hypothetical protein
MLRNCDRIKFSLCVVVVTFSMAFSVLAADTKNESPGYVFDLAAPESEVTTIVKDVAEDPIVRGTYVYEHEKTLTGALPADSSNAFEPWTGPGRIFYKVRTDALSPRHFKESADLGTITIRYIVIPESATRTRVRIDAVFVEDARRKVHISDGSIETSEFNAIQAEVEKFRRRQEEDAAIQKQRQDTVTNGIAVREKQDEAAMLDAAEDSVRNLELRLHELRHDLVLQVKPGGADLKSAPFRAAATLRPIPAGAEVLLEIVTPYWYGVETTDGQRGWLHRDWVEVVP